MIAPSIRANDFKIERSDMNAVVSGSYQHTLEHNQFQEVKASIGYSVGKSCQSRHSCIAVN